MSHCWAQATSLNERAWVIIPTRVMYGLKTLPTPLTYFGYLCGFPHDAFLPRKAHNKF